MKQDGSQQQRTVRPMRRRDRELAQEAAAAILRGGEYGVLCTCGRDGMPYGVPVNYVYTGESIGFHGAAEGHKVENLRDNAQASLTVVGNTCVLPRKFSTLYESAIAFGRVEELCGEEKYAVLRALVAKYCPEYREKGEQYIAHDGEQVAVFALRIERVSGKAHRA